MKILFPLAVLIALIGFSWTLYSVNNPVLTYMSISMLVVIAAIAWGKRK